jgi:putative Mn2+ efflux pump MntP
MDWPTLLGTALALAMDAFAVSIGVSATLRPLGRRQVFRLSFHFGLFQALMPVLGWIGGAAVARQLAFLDHWIAFGLLFVLGLRMIWPGDQARGSGRDPTRGWSLVALSVATSIDALAVGLSLGLMGIAIWIPAAVIGLVALLMTLVGMLIGHRVGRHLGRWASVVGGIVLIVIGGRILAQHLLAEGS